MCLCVCVYDSDLERSPDDSNDCSRQKKANGWRTIIIAERAWQFLMCRDERIRVSEQILGAGLTHPGLSKYAWPDM